MENNNYLIRSAAVDITNKCNFRCLHCYNYSGEHQRESEMSDEEIIKVFKELIHFQPDTMCICGGEPLLRVDLVYKLCDLIKDTPILLNMVSNGYLLTEDIANNLKYAGMNLIQISLDGYTPKAHNWLRNNNQAYDHAVQAIRIARKANIEVGVACCPTKVNLDEIEKLIDLCTELGVSMLRLQPLMVMGRGSNLKKYALSGEDYHILSQKIKNKSNKNLSVEWGDPIQHIESIVYTQRHNDYQDVGITAYGDIMASPYIPVKVGNIRKIGLENYFDAGLQNIYLDKFIKKVASLITEWNNMNLKETLDFFPKLGLDQNINYDLLDKENNDLNVIERIMGFDPYDTSIKC